MEGFRCQERRESVGSASAWRGEALAKTGADRIQNIAIICVRRPPVFAKASPRQAVARPTAGTRVFSLKPETIDIESFNEPN